MTLAKAGEGPTAATTLSERRAIVEAKAAAISTLGVADCLKAQLRRLEPEVCSGAARWPHRLVDSPRAPSRDARAICFKGVALRRGWRQAVVRSLAAFKAQGGSDGSVIGAIVQGAAPAIRERWGP